MGQIGRQCQLVKHAASLVMKEVQCAGTIDHSGVGIAVAVEIGPG
jgi:hypothetical protein